MGGREGERREGGEEGEEEGDGGGEEGGLEERREEGIAWCVGQWAGSGYSRTSTGLSRPCHHNNKH